MTSHKSQGATTATKGISDIKEAFTLDVMLSRVTNQKKFKIIGNFIRNDFIPCNFLGD
jgi:hypothetical protein